MARLSIEMICGWGCGEGLGAREIRDHFAVCPAKPKFDGAAPCWIYIATDQNRKLLKIGATASLSLERKLSSLTAQAWRVKAAEKKTVFRFLAVWRATWAVESTLLKMFSVHRASVGREWFLMNQEMLDYAETMGIQADERQAINPTNGEALAGGDYARAMRFKGFPIEFKTSYAASDVEDSWDRAKNKWPIVRREHCQPLVSVPASSLSVDAPEITDKPSVLGRLLAEIAAIEKGETQASATPFQQDAARVEKAEGTGWRSKLAELDKLEPDYAGELLMDLLGSRRVPAKWSSMRKEAKIEWLEENAPMKGSV